MNEEKKYLNALNLILYANYGTFQKLLGFFGSAGNFWENINSATMKKMGIKDVTIEKILEKHSEIDIEKEFQKLIDQDISILATNELPPLLQQIYDSPIILYAQGDLKILNKKCLSIVGTRNVTNYGKEICEKWIRQMKDYDIAFVSGYAYGVDFEVHKNAFQNNASTIAVLASGLDMKYPSYSRKFVDEMQNIGLFLSEYPLGTSSLSYHFPIRNRIISGLSSVLLVVEAKIKSGSLITAKSALEQNREVFAVPGSVFTEQSGGTNLLISKGEAACAMSCEDILTTLGVNCENKKDNALISLPLVSFASEHEEKIYELLKSKALFFDEILSKINLNSVELATSLSMMEINGIIRDLGGGRYWV